MATSAPKRSRRKVALRRVPTQERGKKRLETILDAAAEVFAESGFEAATTEAIAARAKISIGSLYQYAPNKLSLFQAIAERCLERSRTLTAALLPADILKKPLPRIIDAVIDGFRELQSREPGFRAMAVNRQLHGVYSAAEKSLQDELIQRIQVLVAVKAPHRPPARRKLVATMIVHVISSTLLYIDNEDPAFAKKMLTETKLLLRRYVDPQGKESQS